MGVYVMGCLILSRIEWHAGNKLISYMWVGAATLAVVLQVAGAR